MEKSFAWGAILPPQPDVLPVTSYFGLYSKTGGGGGNVPSLPLCLDLDVWWHLDGRPQTEYRRRAEAQILTIC